MKNNPLEPLATRLLELQSQRDAVAQRGRELAGEYKRWLDLKRTHRLNRAFEQNLLTRMANPGGVLEKYYLRPIPQTVIDRDSGGYPQNKDY